MAYEYTRTEIILLPFRRMQAFWLLVVLGLILDFVVMTVGVLWLCESSSHNWHEPVIVLTVALATLLYGGTTAFQVHARFQRSVLHVRRDILEEDRSIEPWRLINHSRHEIAWIPETNIERRKQVCKEFRRWRESRWKSWKLVVALLSEETGTINYRVCNWPFGSVRLLRVHKPGETDALRRHDHVVRLVIQNRELFPQTAQFLKALPPNKSPDSGNPRYSTDGTSFTGASKVTLEVLPFTKLPTHFAGLMESELKSVATSLGKLQTVVSAGGTCESTLKSEEFPEKSVDEMRNTWRAEVYKAVQEADWLRDDKVRAALAAGNEIVERNLVSIDHAQLDIYSDKRLLIHDVHPHNTFMRGDQCVLIYDFD
jgi:hypothetical protein